MDTGCAGCSATFLLNVEHKGLGGWGGWGGWRGMWMWDGEDDGLPGVLWLWLWPGPA